MTDTAEYNAASAPSPFAPKVAPVEPPPASPAPEPPSPNTYDPIPSVQEPAAQQAQQAQPPQPGQPGQLAQPQKPMVTPVEGHPLHSRIFDGILKTLSGGATKVQMPDGSVREVPQTRGTMAKSILAGALTGMFSGGDIYSKGAGGADRIDPAKVLSQGFNAGQKFRQDQTEEAQRAVDDAQTRKMRNFENNTKMFQQSLAMYGMQHANLDPIVKANQDGILAAATEYDKTSGEPSVFLKKGLTGPEVMQQFKPDGTGYNLSDSNVVIEGLRNVPDAQGNYKPEPLYTIIRPDAKLKLSEDQVKALAKYYPNMENAWDLTKGNINLNASKYIAMQHNVNSIIHAGEVLDNLAQEMGTDKRVDLPALLKGNESATLATINALEHVMAQNGMNKTRTDEDAVIDILKNSGGQKMLDALGTPEEVSTYRNKVETDRTRRQKMAAMVGVNKQGVMNARMILASPDASPEEKQNAQTLITAYEQQEKSDAAIKADAKNKPLEELIPKVASDAINGDVFDVQSVAGRGDIAKGMLKTELRQKAVERGLDPTEYSPTALKAKSAKMLDYTAGKTSKNIQSFDTFLSHSSELYDDLQNLARTNSPWVNTALNKISDSAWSDPALAKLRKDLNNAKQEYQNFLAAGFSPKEIDAEHWDKVFDENQSPAFLVDATKGAGISAGDRLSALGRSYLSDMSTTFPSLLTPHGAAVLKKFGITEKDSDVFALSTPLPKGNGEVLTDPEMMRAFKRAAGGDNVRAVKLIRSNGWYFPETQKDGTVKYGPPANPPQAAPQQ